MKNTFCKILKFEFKQNSFNWAVLLAAYIVATLWMKHESFTLHNTPVLGGSMIPLMIIFLFLLTLHSYSESTTRQGLQMYHLVPVNRNMKFFSKLFITLFIIPVVLIVLFFFLALVVYPLVYGESSRVLLSPFIKGEHIGILFIWAHSTATFFAIVFKKRKLLYVLGTTVALNFGFLILFILRRQFYSYLPKLGMGSGLISGQFAGLPSVLAIIIPLVLYVLSYRLFFRRQL